MQKDMLPEVGKSIAEALKTQQINQIYKTMAFTKTAFVNR